MLFKTAKQVVVFVEGITVLLLGVALIVLPGPAVIVIPLGLAILATEFAWAKHWLRRYKKAANSVISTIKSNVTGRPKPNYNEQTASPQR